MYTYDTSPTKKKQEEQVAVLVEMVCYVSSSTFSKLLFALCRLNCFGECMTKVVCEMRAIIVGKQYLRQTVGKDIINREKIVTTSFMIVLRLVERELQLKC